MTSTLRSPRRSPASIGALLLLLVGLIAPVSSHAATKLFIVVNDLAQIWRVDPVTGAQISSFTLNPPNISSRSGLAFDGTFLYYTDETINYVQAYTEAGVPDHTLPKPGVGNEAGTGLGATKTSVFLVALDGTIYELNSTTGAVLNTFVIPGAAHGLTFAGSLNRLLVVLNDSGTIKKLTLAGADDGNIVTTEVFRGLAFSSSNGVIYGVRQGFLWGVNAATGAILPGYPVAVHSNDIPGLRKTAAAAADEPVLEVCGDGQVNAQGETCDPPGQLVPNTDRTCRDDCTYCGDGEKQTNEQCDDGNTDNNDNCRNDCTLPRCGDGVKDANEGCDDGNLNNGDGCDSNCQPEGFCGDGIVQPVRGEQCDPPKTPTCDATCHFLEICDDLVDNDGDGFIDCVDPDCECGPIGHDPGTIRFGPTGPGHDLIHVHGSIVPQTLITPTNEKVTFLLTKAGGTIKIFETTIDAGDLKQSSRNIFQYNNVLALRSRTGLARFLLRHFPRRGNYTFVIRAFGDLSGATEADMAVQLFIGDDGFLNKSTWKKASKGWTLALPGE